MSVDYLLKVADFFNIPEDQQANKVVVSTSTKSSSTVASKSKITLQSEPVKTDKPNQMTINLKLEKPDIILVEHMDNINTNAVIVNVSLILGMLYMFC